MGQILYQLDAFTDRLFGGNPAAVVPLDAWLDDAALQNIAMENNLAETAYYVPTPDDPQNDFHLRWFTPAMEVDLCGHATLASAAILFRETGWEHDEIRFNSRSGTLVVRKRKDLLELDFPVAPLTERAVPEGFAEAVGAEASYFGSAYFDMAVLADEAAVRAVNPDQLYVAGLDGIGLIVTAPGGDCDFVSRMFAPKAGIPEDPVTGSAHCSLVPYWAEVLGKKELHGRQISSRVGDLYCTLVDDRVLIAGQAVLYMKATLEP